MLANWISIFCYFLKTFRSLSSIHNTKPLLAHSPRVINGFKSILVLHLLIKYDMLRKYIDQKNFKLPLVDEILYSKMCLKRPSQPTDVHVKQINTTLTVFL